ncbi:polymer-forming cytoskeletal protein [Allofranklinella schreckenbergeri]|uniref:Polymer-forming cytoskeletal protein n=1 Tax=Allofranklinella schreckenbergeri TaxID=1076744 RepID=A0A3M6Q0V4_9BURK|nr:polymer-forming cytoskeletal protein [Allofranklinella schreckenbergeri]RMW96151.1 polymer-forming cytoskeletal protein [Allofranklinella schreckenbergeri]RMW96903.1 polymer-forming cytoskeletal protein [Allofranklinella schreckenbergeri]RMX07058.1 polymer-forming cytoskeletal protein [Allofranklinella schreckenbergeri]RRD39226.1 polymer-forming cytoskeletal protein [Comamonadaceae bacterium OH3737_COT-264]
MAQSFFGGGKRTETKPETTAAPAAPEAAPVAVPAAAPRAPNLFAAGGAASFASASPAADGGKEEAKQQSKLTVGPNIKLKGVEITDCDVLSIDGVVEATLESKLIQISEQGSFNGTANIDVAEIRGSFDGELTVREKLTVFATGKVTGKIRYGKLVVEEGASISGEISAMAR